ncbi:MAG: hypothetical protein ACP5JC_00420 [Candidatus Micrarchaeia archaeon]
MGAWKKELTEAGLLLTILTVCFFASSYLASGGFKVNIESGEIYITEKGEFIFAKKLVFMPNAQKGYEITAESTGNESKNVTIVFDYSGEIKNTSEPVYTNGSIMLWNASFMEKEKKRLLVVGENLSIEKPRVFTTYYMLTERNETEKKIVIEEKKEPTVVIERRSQFPAGSGEKTREILTPSYEISRKINIDFPTFLAFIVGLFLLAILSTTTSMLGKKEEGGEEGPKPEKRVPRIFIESHYPEEGVGKREAERMEYEEDEE